MAIVYRARPQGEALAKRLRAAARLLYVAITRAVDQLIMTYHRDSVFTQRLAQALASE